jgi:hypothetical protein
MTDLHKAAQQALEALELAQTDVHWELNSPTRKFLRKAEKNLRAALAGPVEPVPQPGVWMHPWPPVKAQQAEPKGGGRLPPPLQAEPVTEDMKSAVRWAPSSAYWSERLREFFGPDAREGIDALERRIAGAQEPVAWIHTDPDKPRVRFLEWREDEPGYRGRWVKTPLYLAPPQRKPLTDEEIVRIFETPELAGTHFQTPTIKAIAVARAIERAHGIGGQP